MTKEELAQQYAEEKAKVFSDAIKEAYLKGYEQGELKAASSIKINGVKYVDLGLPSGTLWAVGPKYASGAYQMYTSLESNKINIPTKEQVIELIKHTNRLVEDESVYIVGLNGRLSVEIKDYKTRVNFTHYQGEGLGDDDDCNRFWIKSEIKDRKALVLQIDSDGFMDTSWHFAGFKLPLLLVKTREEIEQQ